MAPCCFAIASLSWRASIIADFFFCGGEGEERVAGRGEEGRKGRSGSQDGEGRGPDGGERILDSY